MRGGTFETHPGVHGLVGIAGPDGLAALGLWRKCGTWTARHGRTGVVPQMVADECAGEDLESIERLIIAGLWEPITEGYRMLRGPGGSRDPALCLWRYGGDDLPGSCAVEDSSTTSGQPSARPVP